MTEPLEPEVAPTTMICVIPRTLAATDDPSLQQIYDNQAQYLDTLRHKPTTTISPRWHCSTASGQRCRCRPRRGRTSTLSASS